MIDLFFVYMFLKKLTTPFEKWDAFEHGIIDKNGKILRKKKDLKTIKERESWSKLDIMTLKLKLLLNKVPGGSSKLGTYAAALWLIKEHANDPDMEELNENLVLSELDEIISDMLDEEAPVMSAGGGDIAGIGVGKDGEPGVSKRDQKNRNSKIIKRVMNDAKLE